MLLKKVWRKNYELYGEGCRYLAAIWEGAWKEGIRQGEKITR